MSADSPAFLRLPGRDFKTALFELYRLLIQLTGKIKIPQEQTCSQTGGIRVHHRADHIVKIANHDAVPLHLFLYIFCHKGTFGARKMERRESYAFCAKSRPGYAQLTNQRQAGNSVIISRGTPSAASCPKRNLEGSDPSRRMCHQGIISSVRCCESCALYSRVKTLPSSKKSVILIFPEEMAL